MNIFPWGPSFTAVFSQVRDQSLCKGKRGEGGKEKGRGGEEKGGGGEEKGEVGGWVMIKFSWLSPSP